jgi:hypothetical protein
MFLMKFVFSTILSLFSFRMFLIDFAEAMLDTAGNRVNVKAAIINFFI